jgi:ribose/xylose/arabinose/galactoside ABC-type transport system permease subunit
LIGPALTFLGLSAYWERAIEGAIILAAVSLDAVRVQSWKDAVRGGAGNGAARGGAGQHGE